MNPIVEIEYKISVFVSTFFKELDLMEFSQSSSHVGMIYFHNHYDHLIKTITPSPLSQPLEREIEILYQTPSMKEPSKIQTKIEIGLTFRGLNKAILSSSDFKSGKFSKKYSELLIDKKQPMWDSEVQIGDKVTFRVMKKDDWSQNMGPQ